MKITKVTVYPVKNQVDNILAFAKITLNDQFVVNGIRVMNGPVGNYIEFPNERTGAEKSEFAPTNQYLKNEIIEQVAMEFDSLKGVID